MFRQQPTTPGLRIGKVPNHLMQRHWLGSASCNTEAASAARHCGSNVQFIAAKTRTM
jgi:hypothetical protein